MTKGDQQSTQSHLSPPPDFTELQKSGGMLIVLQAKSTRSETEISEIEGGMGLMKKPTSEKVG